MTTGELNSSGHDNNELFGLGRSKGFTALAGSVASHLGPGFYTLRFLSFNFSLSRPSTLIGETRAELQPFHFHVKRSSARHYGLLIACGGGGGPILVHAHVALVQRTKENVFSAPKGHRSEQGFPDLVKVRPSSPCTERGSSDN